MLMSRDAGSAWAEAISRADATLPGCSARWPNATKAYWVFLLMHNID
jgi:hypothetical protein